MKYSDFFGRRKKTFEKSYELILERMHGAAATPYNIVELGTSRSFVSGESPGCMKTDIQYWRPDEPNCWDWGPEYSQRCFLITWMVAIIIYIPSTPMRMRFRL